MSDTFVLRSSEDEDESGTKDDKIELVKEELRRGISTEPCAVDCCQSELPGSLLDVFGYICVVRMLT